MKMDFMEDSKKLENFSKFVLPNMAFLSDFVLNWVVLGASLKKARKRPDFEKKPVGNSSGQTGFKKARFADFWPAKKPSGKAGVSYS